MAPCLTRAAVHGRLPDRLLRRHLDVVTPGRSGSTGVHNARIHEIAPNRSQLPTNAHVSESAYYDLYVMLDIYSRYVVHWEVHTRENAELAEQFIAAAVRPTAARRPRMCTPTGAPRCPSKPVTALLAELNIAQSHSRPRVSNDNPYSEAQFRTLKYCPAFPERFGFLAHARAFCAEFFAYYNHEHRHSGIGLHTSASVHLGTAGQIRAERARTLQAAYAANPGRFRRRPAPPSLPTAIWINEPVKEETSPDTEQVTWNVSNGLTVTECANAQLVNRSGDRLSRSSVIEGADVWCGSPCKPRKNEVSRIEESSAEPA
ncbi:transposase [Nonomuraea sp. NPDC051941]|uniref:transposase n=1 Tax=Nonomuraea sp. NPDC051941 TaxID=3364373 RepID=UPI0037CA7E90